MREFEIIDHSKDKKDIRGEVISTERLAELYPGRENFAFWRFVGGMRRSGTKEFAVSRAKEFFAKDPDLMFFSIGECAKKEHPQITFLGKNGARGGIEIWNRFAAETYGFSVLQLGDKKDLKKRIGN